MQWIGCQSSPGPSNDDCITTKHAIGDPWLGCYDARCSRPITDVVCLARMASTTNTPAIDTPGIRVLLRRNRGLSWLVLIAGLGMFFGAVTAILVTTESATDLQHDGVHIAGRITAVDHVFFDSVTVSYEYHGEHRQAKIQTDSASPDYEVGQPVTVIIDRSDAHRVTLRGEDNQPVWQVLLIICGLIVGPFVIVGGVLLLARSMHHRRILKRNPLEHAHVESRAWQARAGRRARWIAIALTPDRATTTEANLLLLGGTTARTTRRSGIESATEVDFAGRPDRYVVVWIPHPAKLITLRRPFTAKGRQDLRDRFSPGRVPE